MTRLVLAVLLSSAPAFAGNHPRVELALDPCVDARDEVQRIVQIELGDLLAADHDSSAVRTRVRASCEAGAIVLRVEDPATGQALVRSVALASTAPAVRPRVIGLAIVELVASSWTELEPAPPPPVVTSLAPPPPAPPPVPSEAPPAATTSVANARITANGGALTFSATNAALFGASFRIADGSNRRLGWFADTGIYRGSQALAHGSIDTQVVAFAAGGEVQRIFHRVRGDVGAGVRGGAVEMIGRPSDATFMASAFSARWLGAFTTGHVGVALGERVTVDAMIETGYVLSSVIGLVDHQQAAAVDGTWIAGHIGLGVSL